MPEKEMKKVGREKEYYKDYRKTLTYARTQLRYWQRKIEELGRQERKGSLQGA